MRKQSINVELPVMPEAVKSRINVKGNQISNAIDKHKINAEKKNQSKKWDRKGNIRDLCGDEPVLCFDCDSGK